MKDLIEYIIELFGLNIKSTLAMIDMENDIGEISNHAEYVRYLKAYFNLSDVQYLTAYQKFLELTKRYKRQEIEDINRTKIEKMGTAAERLASKVKEIDTMVMNNQAVKHTWDGFKLSTGELYFTDKEQKALSIIGSPLRCVNLQRSVSGRDILSEKLEKLFVERVTYPQLEAPKQSNNLIANLATALTVRRF
jgi:hypothetical protein